MRHWKLLPATEGAEERLRQETGLSPLLCRVLAARGYQTAQQVQNLFEGSLSDPFLIKDMDVAVRRIAQAIEDGERIVVYGDYDCDGITSTALLYSYLETVGADALYYIPDREVEGYGLNNEAITFLHKVRQVDLIITVDNGVSAHDEIAYAATLGIDVVVTDHHQPKDTLPPAVAVVDPHRPDCPSPFKPLAGVGVAFQLVCALEGAEGHELLEHYGDLVAMGTVGDVVELTGENRVLVQQGIEVLAATQRPGLRALMEVAGVTGKPITSETVAFGLVPRINAAGRMGDVYHALELLLTEGEEEAAALAAQLDDYNRQRKEKEDAILTEILEELREDGSLLQGRTLVLAGEGWHHGVIGILCSRLVERFGKPCFLVSLDGEEARASGRGVPGLSVVEALAACGSLLTRYGGHALAAGFSLRRENLPAFTRAFEEYFRLHQPKMPYNSLLADCTVEPRELTVENVAALEALRPCGAGNPSPVFLLRNLRLEGITPLSGDKHLRLRLSAGGESFQALYFSMSTSRFPHQVGEALDMVATAEVSTYNNAVSVSVKVRDIRPAGYDQEGLFDGIALYEQLLREENSEEISEALLPSREEVGAVYRLLRKNGGFPHGCGLLFGRLQPAVTAGKMLVALDALEELGLITTQGLGAERNISLLPAGEKTDLSHSQTLQRLQRGCVECSYKTLTT